MKKFLLTLFAGILGFGCFCNAGSYTFTGLGGIGQLPIPDKVFGNGCDFTVNCTIKSSGVSYLKFGSQAFAKVGTTWYLFSSNQSTLYTVTSDGITYSYDFNDFVVSSNYGGVCYGIAFFNNRQCQDCESLEWSCTFEGDDIISAGGSCPECPEINTGEILSGYILESEIDTNYCVGNGLCLNECGSGTDFSGDLVFSNLYINNILHPGKSNIFVEIPDYITWDYSTDTGSFNLYVGSGYDVDYINSIIDINSYRPGSEDFTNIFVSGLTLIFPYIFVLLFIIFVWKLLKRVFK